MRGAGGAGCRLRGLWRRRGAREPRSVSAMQPRSASAKSPDANILLLDATKSSAIWSKSERQDLLIC